MRDENGKFIDGHGGMGGFGKGSKHTEKAKEKVSQSLYGKRGRFSRRWKGDAAGYAARHIWLVKNYGKAEKCENIECLGKYKRVEWASISGFNRRDRSDYLHFCTSCHRRYDYGAEIKTEKGTYHKPLAIEVVCPNCNHKHEVKL